MNTRSPPDKNGANAIKKADAVTFATKLASARSKNQMLPDRAEAQPFLNLSNMPSILQSPPAKTTSTNVNDVEP